MKQAILVLAAITTALQISAQVSISHDNSAPDPSAMLEVKSNVSGILVPRMSFAERDAIVAPAKGLLVFCNDDHQFYYNRGNTLTPNWKPIGGIAGVTATAPLTSTGNQDPNIAMPQAGPAQSGYLSNSDWVMFNSKVSSQWTSLAQDITFNAGRVGIGTNVPAASALVDMSSDHKGVLLPRMTLDQRNAITSPADGLMVFCLDCGISGSLSLYSGGTWKTFSPCNTPLPASGIHGVSPGQIIWRWAATAGALGYKWSTNSSFSQAIDMGSLTSKTETGLDCDTSYNRYLWSYDACGVAGPVVLTQAVASAPPAAPVEATHLATQTAITWRWHPVAGATGYKWNTINNYATATDNGADTVHIEADSCGTAYTRFVWAYNGCGFSVVDTLTQSTLPCWACGITTITINHIVGAVAPVTKTTTYGTVTNIPGEPTLCWLTSNLGSDHQATAASDATEASAGWYWQFNRKQGYKHDGTTRTPNTTWISSINENSDWITANDPCTIEMGTNWRIPTYTEWYNVDNSGGWTTWNGPWGSGLKLHAAGCINYNDGSLGNRGSYGYSWSSTQSSVSNGWNLSFNSGYSSINSNNKAFGLTLRCLRDN